MGFRVKQPLDQHLNLCPPCRYRVAIDHIATSYNAKYFDKLTAVLPDRFEGIGQKVDSLQPTMMTNQQLYYCCTK